MQPLYFPNQGARSGTKVEYIKSRNVIAISGWYDSFVNIERHEIDMDKFLENIGYKKEIKPSNLDHLNMDKIFFSKAREIFITLFNTMKVYDYQPDHIEISNKLISPEFLDYKGLKIFGCDLLIHTKEDNRIYLIDTKKDAQMVFDITITNDQIIVRFKECTPDNIKPSWGRLIYWKK